MSDRTKLYFWENNQDIWYYADGGFKDSLKEPPSVHVKWSLHKPSCTNLSIFKWSTFRRFTGFLHRFWFQKLDRVFVIISAGYFHLKRNKNKQEVKLSVAGRRSKFRIIQAFIFTKRRNPKRFYYNLFAGT